MGCASDLPLGQLAAFALPGDAPADPPAARPVRPVGTPVYDGPGWVGGRLCRVESRRGRTGYLLRIEGAGEFEIAGDGSAVSRRASPPGPTVDEELEAALLGPCLALALALRGVWCLHAAAVVSDGTAVALAGESGSGKSTLAAAVSERAAGWRRAADDLLPVRLADAEAWALPRFPQPKLASGLQWSRPAPGSLVLAAVHVLEPGGEQVRARRLPARVAALALVRQTVAARLFDADLQARHLDFCAELAGRLPVCALRFPRRREALPEMVGVVAG